jgi:hypothetical protein
VAGCIAGNPVHILAEYRGLSVNNVDLPNGMTTFLEHRFSPKRRLNKETRLTHSFLSIPYFKGLHFGTGTLRKR